MREKGHRHGDDLCRSAVEKTGQCAKEEVSSSLLGKLAPPFLQTYS